MKYILMSICSLLVFGGIAFADDYTQQQILNEVRDMNYRQQYNRTLDSWTDSIRRTNRQNNRNMDNWDGNDSDSYEYDWEDSNDNWHPDPDGGLVIPGGHFE